MNDRGLDLLKRLWLFLSPRRKWQVVMLLMLMGCGAFLEMLSLGAILPFLAVLVDPTTIMRRPHLAQFALLLGIHSPEQLVGPLTAVFIGVALISGTGRLALVWANQKMSYLVGADLSAEVYKRTLYQPFSVHVTRNSSQLIASVTKKVTQTIQVFQSLLTAVTAGVLAVGIMVALLLVNAVIASLAAVIFGGSYILVARFTRRRLLKNGKLIKESGTRLVKALQEGLGGIRDVLLDGTQAAHCTAYRKVDRPLRRATASNGFISASPRVVMEAFGISCIASLAYFLTLREGTLSGFLPVLGALALGAQRLLPAFQQVFVGYAGFVGNQASLAEIIALLEQPLPADALEPSPPPLDFQREIRFEHVHFRYSESSAWVLTDVNLVIEKGSRVGVVGKTGGGKSTSIDLLMGLLDPTEGKVLVDGQPISGSHRRAWQRVIAHVPQSIFLLDATMAENIAFGIPSDKIDIERVRQAARIAHIADFIESQPDGYTATVGERGVRLSGGQRQRIGIARALYKEAKVLVFDEATSALDTTTERELMDDIERLSRDLTVLMIAHRISTVQDCDKIIVIDQGQIAAVGPYDRLLESSEVFRSLVAQRQAD